MTESKLELAALYAEKLAEATSELWKETMRECGVPVPAQVQLAVDAKTILERLRVMIVAQAGK